MYVGIDVGGMSIKCGIVDSDGNIIYRKSAKTIVNDIDACEKVIVDLCLSVIDEAQLYRKNIKSVGIGIPGTVDKNGIVGFAPNIGWKNVDISNQLSDAIGINVKIGKDSNCALIAETLFGVAKDYKNVAMVTIGTGVGTAFLCDGKLLLGNNGAAGEGGHIRLYYNDLQCACGRKDCWELYASASSLERRMHSESLKHPNSLLAKIEAMRGRADGIGFFEAVAQNDEVAIEVLDDYRKDIVAGMVTLSNIFRPELIVLGGGVSKQKVLIDTMEDILNNELVGGENNPRVKLKSAHFDNDAGIIGAAAFASDLANDLI